MNSITTNPTGSNFVVNPVVVDHPNSDVVTDDSLVRENKSCGLSIGVYRSIQKGMIFGLGVGAILASVILIALKLSHVKNSEINKSFTLIVPIGGMLVGGIAGAVYKVAKDRIITIHPEQNI